jgi:hypothetical protein
MARKTPLYILIYAIQNCGILHRSAMCGGNIRTVLSLQLCYAVSTLTRLGAKRGDNRDSSPGGDRNFSPPRLDHLAPSE